MYATEFTSITRNAGRHEEGKGGVPEGAGPSQGTRAEARAFVGGAPRTCTRGTLVSSFFAA